MKAVYYVPWILFRAVFSTYFRWRVYEANRVPPTGPVLLAANHASLLDPPLVGATLRRDICYLARENLFRNPLFGAVLRSWNVVPVDRDGGGAAGLRAIMERLQAGNAVIVFPEGTRTQDGALQPARSGIGLLAIKMPGPGGASSGFRHLRRLWPADATTPAAAGGGEVWMAAEPGPMARGSPGLFQGQAEGDLPGHRRRDHGADRSPRAVRGQDGISVIAVAWIADLTVTFIGNRAWNVRRAWISRGSKVGNKRNG